MENTTQASAAVQRAVSSHPRLFEKNYYVYPVLSRRSGGISVGINLNPDKICNFDCIYCQVDRTTPPVLREVDPDRILAELEHLLRNIQSGILFEHPTFKDIPTHLKRVNDIAFSGDGEPTTYPDFKTLLERVAALKSELNLHDVKINVITNCTRFHRPEVQQAFEILHQNNGEIWAKLDAGTAPYYDLVERTRISFEQVIANLKATAKKWPLVIQSLFMRIHNEPPPPEEIEAFASILQEGGRLKLIQIYTVARRPAEAYVTALNNDEIDRLADTVRQNLPGVPVEVFYGSNPNSQDTQ